MTNRIAIGLFLVLILAFLVDYLWQDFSAALFVARRFVMLVEMLAFWR